MGRKAIHCTQSHVILDAVIHRYRAFSHGPAVSGRRSDDDRALYLKQLEDLVAELGIDEPLKIVGVSFGSALAATFAENHPDQVARQVLISAVVDYAEDRRLFGLAKVPVLGEWLTRVFIVRRAVSRANGFIVESGANSSYAVRFDEQARFEGFEQALLSMFRSDALTSHRDTYAALVDQPKLLIWGTNDAEIPIEHLEFIRKNTSNVSFLPTEGAGHGVNLQRGEEIQRKIVEFLQDSGPLGI